MCGEINITKNWEPEIGRYYTIWLGSDFFESLNFDTKAPTPEESIDKAVREIGRYFETHHMIAEELLK